MNDMPKKVDTVILPVAGVGSRMLPLTSAIEKCMLPVAGRPLIEYAIMDCQKAGITRVIFICSERGEGQLKDYFGELSYEVEEQLKALMRDDLIEQEQKRRNSYGLSFEYIRQEPDQDYGYGTVVPLHLARDILADSEYFAYFMGDDIVFHQDGSSELDRAIKAWQDEPAEHLVMSTPVAPEKAPHYAILTVGPDRKLASMVEKPEASEVSGSPVAFIGRSIFGKNIWQFVDAEMQQARLAPDEHQLTTHVIEPAVRAGQVFYVHQITGAYLDGGSPKGLHDANNYITDMIIQPR
jgi:UTP--glucose-1-phosphate uridylyltransferase